MEPSLSVLRRSRAPSCLGDGSASITWRKLGCGCLPSVPLSPPRALLGRTKPAGGFALPLARLCCGAGAGRDGGRALQLVSQAELCLPLRSGKQIPLFYSLSIVRIMSGSLLSQTRALLPLGLGQLALSEHGLIGVSAWLSWDEGSTALLRPLPLWGWHGATLGQAWQRNGAVQKVTGMQTFPRSALVAAAGSGGNWRGEHRPARLCRAAAALAPAWSPGASSCP